MHITLLTNSHWVQGIKVRMYIPINHRWVPLGQDLYRIFSFKMSMIFVFANWSLFITVDAALPKDAFKKSEAKASECLS